MTPRHLLVPTDFSAHATHALDYACRLATELGGTVSLVHVLGSTSPELSVSLTDAMMEGIRAGARKALDKLATERTHVAVFDKVLLKIGDAREQIVRTAEEIGADLVVIGSHGRRGLPRLVLGSVAEDVLRLAPCPVLVVRLSHADGEAHA